MQHYAFNNSHLPNAVRMIVHITIALFLSIITVKIVLTALDFFQIGIVWLQTNTELGTMIMVLILIISFLIFDSLLKPITEIGGILSALFLSIKDEYDVQVYLRREYTSTVDELDYIRENFAKNFDLKSFCDFTESGVALEGVEFSQKVEINPEKIEEMRIALQNACSIDDINNIAENVNETEIVPVIKNDIPKSIHNVHITPEEVETPEDLTDDFSFIFKEINATNGTPINIETFGDSGSPLEKIEIPEDNDVLERLKRIGLANKVLIEADRMEKSRANLKHEDSFYVSLRKLKEKQKKL